MKGRRGLLEPASVYGLYGVAIGLATFKPILIHIAAVCFMNSFCQLSNAKIYVESQEN